MAVQSFSDYLNHIGDRTDLYELVAGYTGAQKVIYPGSYLDLAPSYIWHDVTYLDSDARAQRAFAQPNTAQDLARRFRRYAYDPSISFVAGDYTHTLNELPRDGWELAISMYTGPVFEHIKQCIQPGGWLLANNSHADAGLAFLDPDYQLVAAVSQHDDGYQLITENLNQFFQPKRPPHPTNEYLLNDGRGVRYTRTADVYLFRRAAINPVGTAGKNGSSGS
ncbi:hypothetical protein [Corynebacterium alimapuense]|uniref:Class I SAM-dependent methyltransferase n=1 Tax=Corynebacterium alimapuense TaxID=1576874 RepID=A0A3M8KAE9_9CORY|nr:hypothetical protein [Corynebacterium alimapuense]RNE49438.1 hypothetical protein C5L39_03485 [Corynebacterium alimapuense]